MPHRAWAVLNLGHIYVERRVFIVEELRAVETLSIKEAGELT